MLEESATTKDSLVVRSGDRRVRRRIRHERRLAERGLREARETLDLLARTLRSQSLVSDALEGILGNIEQTMFGEPLYRTREEKAANLLYFLVKDHPFTDGNKRIGSLLFLIVNLLAGPEVFGGGEP